MEEEEGAKLLAEASPREVAPFSSEEIRIKNLVFRTEVAVTGGADLMPKNSGLART